MRRAEEMEMRTESEEKEGFKVLRKRKRAERKKKMQADMKLAR